jgi:hypothetical protein
MICSVLALSLSKKAIKKLSNRYSLVPKQKTFDYAYGFYRLHQLSHETEGLVNKAVTRTLNAQHVKYIKQLEEIDSTDVTVLESYIEDGMSVSPGGVLWSLLTEPRDELQSQGVYYAHKLVYNLLQKAVHGTEACDEEHVEKNHNEDSLNVLTEENTSLRNELKALTGKLDESINTVECLNKEHERMKKYIRELEDRPNRENLLRRENRKLKYRLDEMMKRAQTLKEPQPSSPTICPFEVNERPEKEELPRDGITCQQPDDCPLNALKIAVVGGLDRLEPRYRSIVERLGGQFVFHSGNCNNGTHTLRNIVCGSDIVVFITSVNSHNAMWAVKAECKKSGKKFIALKRTGPEALEYKLLSEMAM